MWQRIHPSPDDILMKDDLIPIVDPAELKSVWAMQEDVIEIYPGQQVGIGADLYQRVGRSKRPSGFLSGFNAANVENDDRGGINFALAARWKTGRCRFQGSWRNAGNWIAFWWTPRTAFRRLINNESEG